MLYVVCTNINVGYHQNKCRRAIRRQLLLKAYHARQGIYRRAVFIRTNMTYIT